MHPYPWINHGMYPKYPIFLPWLDLLFLTILAKSKAANWFLVGNWISALCEINLEISVLGFGNAAKHPIGKAAIAPTVIRVVNRSKFLVSDRKANPLKI